MKGGGVFRTASVRLFAGITAGLVAVLGVGPGTAFADDYTPVAYIEGVVSAPPGTQLDQLRVQLSSIQSTLGHIPVPVGADGRFRAPYGWLEYANVKVLAGETGLADTWYGNVSRQEESTNLPVSRRGVTGVDISMARGSSISGTVTVPSGTDLTQLTVVAESKFISPSRSTHPATVRTAVVSADGSYRISGLGGNSYTVRVQPGANSLLESWYGSGSDKVAAKDVQVAAEANVNGIDIGLAKPASVSGTAVFPPGSTPEPGFVALYSEKGNRIAGGSFGIDGSFHLPQVPAGNSKITFGVNAPQGSFATMWYPEAGELAAGELLSLGQGEERTGLKLTMKPAGSITGTVSGTGGAAVGIRLLDSLGRLAGSTTTDAAGGYVLNKVGPGAFKVRFAEPWYTSTSNPYMPQFYPGIPEDAGYTAGADVTVAPGQARAGIDAAMTKGAAISGVILDALGKPLASHSVNTVSLDGAVDERRAWTDRTGVFLISGLADGDYILETNFDPYAASLVPLGHLYSGNVRDLKDAQTISIRNGQTADAGTLSYGTAGKTPSPAAGKFVPVSPTRILDTRTTFPVAPNTNLIVQVAGKAGVPSDASAVAVNVTVTEPSSYGFVYASPFGELNLDTSNVNYDVQETIPNYVIVPIKEGKISLGNEGMGTAHLIADVAGYFTGGGVPTDSGGYQALTPFRAADSRDTGGTPGGQQLDVQMVGLSRLPSDVGAVVVNLTAALVWSSGTSTSYGHLTAFASGTSRPATSNVNYERSTGNTPNLAIVPVGADGKITIANTSPGPVGIVVDVMGYFLKGSAATAGSFQSMTPQRLLDTRSNSTPVGAGKDISVAVAGVNSVPAGARAAMVNLTATEPTSYGHLAAYPTGQALPATSNINYSNGQTVANFAVVPIGADGKITIRNTSTGETHLIVDIMGYILG